MDKMVFCLVIGCFTLNHSGSEIKRFFDQRFLQMFKKYNFRGFTHITKIKRQKRYPSGRYS